MFLNFVSMDKKDQKNLDEVRTEIKKELAVEAEELLTSELSEVEGGAMASCTNCKLLCYNELI